MATIVLGDIVTIVKEVVNPKTCGFDKFVGLEHYDAGEPLITRYGSPENLDTNVKHFCKGDILVARRNVYLKRAGYVDFEGVTSGDSIVLRVKDPVYLRILPFILNTEDFWDYAEQNSDGTMSKRLSPDDLLDYEFEEPADKEVLADKLWAAYRVKESYRKLLATTDDMVKAKYIDMFEGRKSWPIQKLKDIVDPNCPISYGIVQPGEELEEGVPIVRPVDLNSELYVFRKGLKKTSEEISNSYKRTILRGDELLMCVRGTTGLMGIATEELKGCNVTRGITPLYFKEGYNRFYVLCVLLSDEIQKFIKDHTVGSTLKGINMSIVRDIEIPIAPLEIQNEFEQVFVQAEATKASLRQSIDAIDRVIRSLINQ